MEAVSRIWRRPGDPEPDVLAKEGLFSEDEALGIFIEHTWAPHPGGQLPVILRVLNAGPAYAPEPAHLIPPEYRLR